MATILFLMGTFKTFTQLMKHSVNASGFRAMKTLRNVSCEGMPLGNSRNFLSQPILERANSSMAVKALAPQIVANTAIKRTSPNLCNCVRCMRGSSILAKWLKNDADGMGTDMLLLLHEREGSFRSVKHCSRVPCQNQALPPNLWVNRERFSRSSRSLSSVPGGHGQEEAAGCGMTRKSQRHLGRPSVRKLLADNFPPRTFQDAPTNYPQSRATVQVFLLPNGELRERRQAHRRQNAPA